MVREKSIVLFDGVCNLCNAAVNFIIDKDSKDQFRFGSLQSEKGKIFLQRHNLPEDDLQTIVLIENDKYYLRSTAVLKIARKLGGIWSLFSIFLILPPLIRDFFYNLVAKSRYSLFGRRNTCRVPTPQLEKKFL